MKDIISVAQLAYTYPGLDDQPGVVVFEDMNLTIQEGTFVAILGTNGCGKSTLAKHFNSILLPGGGKVYVCGIDTANEERLLSGGQKQRIAIVRALAMEPKCIDLDEPTAMLDPRGRREVIETIGRLNREKGITVVLITHHMDEAAKADRVVVLHKGKVTTDGTPAQVFSQAELLHSIGLAAPEAVELCWELNKQGFDLPMDKLDPEACAQALYDAIKA